MLDSTAREHHSKLPSATRQAGRTVGLSPSADTIVFPGGVLVSTPVMSSSPGLGPTHTGDLCAHACLSRPSDGGAFVPSCC